MTLRLTTLLQLSSEILV